MPSVHWQSAISQNVHRIITTDSSLTTQAWVQSYSSRRTRMHTCDHSWVCQSVSQSVSFTIDQSVHQSCGSGFNTYQLNKMLTEWLRVIYKHWLMTSNTIIPFVDVWVLSAAFLYHCTELGIRHAAAHSKQPSNRLWPCEKMKSSNTTSTTMIIDYATNQMSMSHEL